MCSFPRHAAAPQAHPPIAPTTATLTLPKNGMQGQYVFDHSWADAAHRLGVRYYPKLQACVPFSPVTGPRLIVAAAEDGGGPEVAAALARAVASLADDFGVSSAHVTFCTGDDLDALRSAGFEVRTGVQYWWQNRGYTSFADYEAALAQKKRKAVRQERKRVRAAGLATTCLPGSAVTPALADRMYAFYTDTVDRKWGERYLTRGFFHAIMEALPDRVRLVVAHDVDHGPDDAGAVVAGALNLVGSHALFGRHWGADPAVNVPGLHFEVSYYAAIEHAIEAGLARVEAGAQGEHKLARGYLPHATLSGHYVRDPQLGGAVADFLRRERAEMDYVLDALTAQASPYKKEGGEGKAAG